MKEATSKQNTLWNVQVKPAISMQHIASTANIVSYLLVHISSLRQQQNGTERWGATNNDDNQDANRFRFVLIEMLSTSLRQ